MDQSGHNSDRSEQADLSPAAERITMALLVFIPHLAGYYMGKLAVLKLCLESLVRHTSIDYDLLVFDNGSCDEVRGYLRQKTESGVIDVLIESAQNVGKLEALRAIFSAAPGEIVAFSDEDVFFYPHWDRAQLALLRSFPSVAMVSGCAVRALFEYGHESAVRWAEADPEARLSWGRRISEEREAEWAESTGRQPDEHLASIRERHDLLIEYRGMKAFAAANHFQFLAPRRMLQQYLGNGWSGRLMGGLRELEQDLVADGFLRLCTYERTTRHIGSVLVESMVEEARTFGIEGGPAYTLDLGPSSQVLAWLASIRPARGAMKRVYSRLFWEMQWPC